MADLHDNLDEIDEIDEIDDIDDIDYNQYNNDQDLDVDIEDAIKMSLNDVNNEYSKVTSIFNQYISADDEIKNYILEGLSENELSEIFNMIEGHNKEIERQQEELKRELLIRFQNEEYNQSLLDDFNKTLLTDTNKDKYEDKYEDQSKIKEKVKKVYDKFTKNPQQLSLFEHNIRKVIRKIIIQKK